MALAVASALIFPSMAHAAGNGRQPTAAERRIIIQHFESILRDAQGARWTFQHKMRNANGSWYFCGMVNATNGFGGFTGNTGFYIALDGERVLGGDVMLGTGISAAFC